MKLVEWALSIIIFTGKFMYEKNVDMLHISLSLKLEYGWDMIYQIDVCKIEDKRFSNV